MREKLPVHLRGSWLQHSGHGPAWESGAEPTEASGIGCVPLTTACCGPVSLTLFSRSLPFLSACD